MATFAPHLHAWNPAGPARAVVWIVHGIGEHGGRYARAANALVAAGFAVRALDQRGHGRSPGARGHVSEWREYRDDLHAALATDRAGPLPLFLLGHSMGALVVMDYLLAHPDGIRGAVLSAPAVAPAAADRPLLVLLARVLSRLCPRKTLPLDLDLDSLSRDPGVHSDYLADSLVHARTTARWGMETLGTIKELWRRRMDFRTPMLILQGLDDRINRPEGTRAFAQGLPPGLATLRELPRVRHEPQHDPDAETILAGVAEWINARLAEP